MIKAFLSVSVPLPDRDPRFMATADVIAIRESVKALVGEVIPVGSIVFGGHPAITPLMALLLRGLGANAKKRIALYQSAYFAEQFAAENDDFLEVQLTPNVERSRDKSLAEMRRCMIGDTDFDVGVFIGGMEGVLDEFAAFRERHPNAHIWPIASTGAAANEVFEVLGSQRPELFREEMTYQTLFRKLISELN